MSTDNSISFKGVPIEWDVYEIPEWICKICRASSVSAYFEVTEDDKMVTICEVCGGKGSFEEMKS